MSDRAAEEKRVRDLTPSQLVLNLAALAHSIQETSSLNSTVVWVAAEWIQSRILADTRAAALIEASPVAEVEE